MMVDDEGMKIGVYKEKNNKIMLSLNEWVEYPFDMDSKARYWVVRASYSQIV